MTPYHHRSSREKAALWFASAAIAGLTVLSARQIDVDLRALGGGFDDVANLLVLGMLLSELDDPPRVGELLVETLMMALPGTVLATFISIPLAFLAASQHHPAPGCPPTRPA